MQIAPVRPPKTRPLDVSKAARSKLLLTIDQAAYVLLSLSPAAGPSRRAYRLVKADGAVYDLLETSYGAACDCPDYIFRRDGLDPSGCKHIKALVRHGLIANR